MAVEDQANKSTGVAFQYLYVDHNISFVENLASYGVFHWFVVDASIRFWLCKIIEEKIGWRIGLFIVTETRTWRRGHRLEACIIMYLFAGACANASHYINEESGVQIFVNIVCFQQIKFTGIQFSKSRVKTVSLINVT